MAAKTPTHTHTFKHNKFYFLSARALFAAAVVVVVEEFELVAWHKKKGAQEKY
jgi:hypothetical protein